MCLVPWYVTPGTPALTDAHGFATISTSVFNQPESLIDLSLTCSIAARPRPTPLL
jgi:hypothetical protein